MQTTVDVGPSRQPRGRHWFRWLAVAVAVVAIGAALLLRGLVSQAEEPTLSELLAAEVATVLEAASPDEHADHGHHFADEGQVLCVAEVFGFDPPHATTVAEVQTAYAQHMCAIVAADWPWPSAVRASGPLAVELTDPPEVLLPDRVDLGEEALHQDRIRALIPERYHEPALALGFADPSLMDDLRRRVEAAS